MPNRDLTIAEAIERELNLAFGEFRYLCTKWAAQKGITLEAYATRMILDLLRYQRATELLPSDN